MRVVGKNRVKSTINSEYKLNKKQNLNIVNNALNSLITDSSPHDILHILEEGNVEHLVEKLGDVEVQLRDLLNFKSDLKTDKLKKLMLIVQYMNSDLTDESPLRNLQNMPTWVPAAVATESATEGLGATEPTSSEIDAATDAGVDTSSVDTSGVDASGVDASSYAVHYHTQLKASVEDMEESTDQQLTGLSAEIKTAVVALMSNLILEQKEQLQLLLYHLLEKLKQLV